jgi:ribosome biogenesis GTPase
MAETIRGEVLFGINSIYTVSAGNVRFQCRIKGKKLREDARSYNPIAPGDIVDVIPDELSPGEGMIAGVLPRRTRLERWNKKGRAPQVLAANVDLAVCITSPSAPPFRPRFVDRLIVAAESGGVTPLVVLNKCDLPCPADIEERLSRYAGMGYRVHACSALTGQGVAEFSELLRGKTAVLVGHSGVGKSSLVNSLAPDSSQRVGKLSQKYDRGNHTTNFSALFILSHGIRIVDTPGVRELELAGVLPEEVGFHFRDFAPFMQSCAYQPCLHVDEPDCAVAAGVEEGRIHPDRYESYLRIVAELQDARRTAHG